MAVVSRAIPTLLRGISQAADSTKQADHADIQDNANSNPVQGLVKRSGTQFITNLSSSTVGKSVNCCTAFFTVVICELP